MIFNPKNNIVKIIAIIVCACFLWQDVAMAAGSNSHPGGGAGHLRQEQFLEQPEQPASLKSEVSARAGGDDEPAQTPGHEGSHLRLLTSDEDEPSPSEAGAAGDAERYAVSFAKETHQAEVTAEGKNAAKSRAEALQKALRQYEKHMQRLGSETSSIAPVIELADLSGYGDKTHTAMIIDPESGLPVILIEKRIFDSAIDDFRMLVLAEALAFAEAGSTIAEFAAGRLQPELALKLQKIYSELVFRKAFLRLSKENRVRLTELVDAADIDEHIALPTECLRETAINEMLAGASSKLIASIEPQPDAQEDIKGLLWEMSDRIQQNSLSHWLKAFDNGMDISRRGWGDTPRAFRRKLVKRLAALNHQRRPHQLTVPNFSSIEVRKKGEKVRNLGSLYAWYSDRFKDYIGIKEYEAHKELFEGQTLSFILHELSDADDEDGVLLPNGCERVLIWHKGETGRGKEKILQFIINCALYEPDFQQGGFFLPELRVDPATGNPAPLGEDELKRFLLENDLLYHGNWTRSTFSRAVFKDWFFSTTGIVETVAGGADEFYELVEKALSEPEIREDALKRGFELPHITADEMRGAKSRAKVTAALRLFYRYNRYIVQEVIGKLTVQRDRARADAETFLKKAEAARTKQDEWFDKAAAAEDEAKRLSEDLSKKEAYLARLKECGLAVLLDEPMPYDVTQDEESFNILEEWAAAIDKRLRQIFKGENPDEKFLDILEAVRIGLFSRDELESTDEQALLDDICEVLGSDRDNPRIEHEVDIEVLEELAKKIKPGVVNAWAEQIADLKEILFEKLRRLGIPGRITLADIDSMIRASRAFESACYIADELQEMRQDEPLGVLSLDGGFGLLAGSLPEGRPLGLPEGEEGKIAVTTVSDPVSSKLKISAKAKQKPHRLLTEPPQEEFDAVASIFQLQPDDNESLRRLIEISQNALKVGGRVVIALPHTLGFYNDTIWKLEQCGFSLERQVLVQRQLGASEGLALMAESHEEFRQKAGSAPRFVLAVFVKTKEVDLSTVEGSILYEMAAQRMDLQDITVVCEGLDEGEIPFSLKGTAVVRRRPGIQRPDTTGPTVLKRQAAELAKIPAFRYRSEQERLAYTLRLVIKYQRYILESKDRQRYEDAFFDLASIDWFKSLIDIEIDEKTKRVKSVRLNLQTEGDMAELVRRVQKYLSQDSSNLKTAAAKLGVLFQGVAENYVNTEEDGSEFAIFKEPPGFEHFDFERAMELIWMHRDNEFLFSENEREFIENFASDVWLTAARPLTRAEAAIVKQLYTINIIRYSKHKHRLFWLATVRKKSHQAAAYIDPASSFDVYRNLITNFSAQRVVDILREHFSRASPGEPLSGLKASLADLGSGAGTMSVNLYLGGFHIGDDGLRTIELDNNPVMLSIPRVITAPVTVAGQTESASVEIPTTKVLSDAQRMDEGFRGNDIEGSPVSLEERSLDAMTSLFLVDLFKRPEDRLEFFFQARHWLKTTGIFALTYPKDINFNQGMTGQLQKMGYGVSMPQVCSQRVRDEIEQKIEDWLSRERPNIYKNSELRKRVVARVKAFVEKPFTVLLLWKERDTPDRDLKDVLDPAAFEIAARIGLEKEAGPPSAAPRKLQEPTFDPVGFTVNTAAEEYLLTEAQPSVDLEETEVAMLSRQETEEKYPAFELMLGYLAMYRELFTPDEQGQIGDMNGSWNAGAQLIPEGIVHQTAGLLSERFTLAQLENAQASFVPQGEQTPVEFLRTAIFQDRPFAVLGMLALLEPDERKSALDLINRMRRPGYDGTLSLSELSNLERWLSALANTAEAAGQPFQNIVPNSAYYLLDETVRGFYKGELTAVDMSKEQLKALFERKEDRRRTVNLLSVLGSCDSDIICYNFDPAASPAQVAERLRNSAGLCAKGLVDALVRECTKKKKGEPDLATIESWAAASISQICSVFEGVQNPLPAAEPAEPVPPEPTEGELPSWPESAELDFAAILLERLGDVTKGLDVEKLGDFIGSPEIVNHPFLRARPTEEIESYARRIIQQWNSVSVKLEQELQDTSAWRLDGDERQTIETLVSNFCESDNKEAYLRNARQLRCFVMTRNSANRQAFAHLVYASREYDPASPPHGVFSVGDAFKDARPGKIPEEVRWPEGYFIHFNFYNELSDMAGSEKDPDKLAAFASDYISRLCSMLYDPELSYFMKADLFLTIAVCVGYVHDMKEIKDMVLMTAQITPAGHPLKIILGESGSLRRVIDENTPPDKIERIIIERPFTAIEEICHLLNNPEFPDRRKRALERFLIDLFASGKHPILTSAVFCIFMRMDDREGIKNAFTKVFASRGWDAATYYYIVSHGLWLWTAGRIPEEKDFATDLFRARLDGWENLASRLESGEIQPKSSKEYEDLIAAMDLEGFCRFFPQVSDWAVAGKLKGGLTDEEVQEIESAYLPDLKAGVPVMFIRRYKDALAKLAAGAIDRFIYENPQADLGQRLSYAADVFRRLGFIDRQQDSEKAVRLSFQYIGSFGRKSAAELEKAIAEEEMAFFEKLALIVQYACVSYDPASGMTCASYYNQEKDMGQVKKDLEVLMHDPAAAKKVRALQLSWPEFFPAPTDAWIQEHGQWMQRWFMASPQNQQMAAELFEEPPISYEELQMLAGLIEVFLKAPEEGVWNEIKDYILSQRGVLRAVVFMQLVYKRRSGIKDSPRLERMDKLLDYAADMLKRLGLAPEEPITAENIFDRISAYYRVRTACHYATDTAARLKLWEMLELYEDKFYEFFEQAAPEIQDAYGGFAPSFKAQKQQGILQMQQIFATFGLEGVIDVSEGPQSIYERIVDGYENSPSEKQDELDELFVGMLKASDAVKIYIGRKVLEIRLRRLYEKSQAEASATGGQQELDEVTENLLKSIWQNVLQASGMLRPPDGSEPAEGTITLPTLDAQLEVLRPLVLAYPSLEHGKIAGRLLDEHYTESESKLFIAVFQNRLVPLLNALEATYLNHDVSVPLSLTEAAIEQMKLYATSKMKTDANFGERLEFTRDLLTFCRLSLPQGRTMSLRFRINAFAGLYYVPEAEQGKPLDFFSFINWLFSSEFAGLTEEEVVEKLKQMPVGNLHPWFVLMEGSFPHDFGQRFLQFQQAWDAFFPEYPVDWRKAWFDRAFERVLRHPWFLWQRAEQKKYLSAEQFVDCQRLVRQLNDGIAAHPLDQARKTAERLQTETPVADGDNFYDLIQAQRDCVLVLEAEGVSSEEKMRAAMGLRLVGFALTDYLLDSQLDGAGGDINIARREIIRRLLDDVSAHRLPWYTPGVYRVTSDLDIFKYSILVLLDVEAERDDIKMLPRLEVVCVSLIKSIADHDSRRPFLEYIGKLLHDGGVCREDLSESEAPVAKIEGPQLKRLILFYRLCKSIFPEMDFEHMNSKIKPITKRPLSQFRLKDLPEIKHIKIVSDAIKTTNCGVCLMIDQVFEEVTGAESKQPQPKPQAISIFPQDLFDGSKTIETIVNSLKTERPDFTLFLSFILSSRSQSLLGYEGDDSTMPIGLPAHGYKNIGFAQPPIVPRVSDVFMWAMSIRNDVREKVKALTLDDDPVISMCAADLIFMWLTSFSGMDTSESYQQNMEIFIQDMWRNAFRNAGWRIDGHVDMLLSLFFKISIFEKNPQSKDVKAFLFNMLLRAKDATMEELEGADDAEKAQAMIFFRDVFRRIAEICEDEDLQKQAAEIATGLEAEPPPAAAQATGISSALIVDDDANSAGLTMALLMDRGLDPANIEWRTSLVGEQLEQLKTMFDLIIIKKGSIFVITGITIKTREVEPQQLTEAIEDCL